MSWYLEVIRSRWRHEGRVPTTAQSSSEWGWGRGQLSSGEERQRLQSLSVWCASSMALPTSDALFAPRYLLFCPLPLCTWAPGCISLGYSAFSATNTALSTSNLYKKWFQVLIHNPEVDTLYLQFFVFHQRGRYRKGKSWDRNPTQKGVHHSAWGDMWANKKATNCYSLFLRKGT